MPFGRGLSVLSAFTNALQGSSSSLPFEDKHTPHDARTSRLPHSSKHQAAKHKRVNDLAQIATSTSSTTTNDSSNRAADTTTTTIPAQNQNNKNRRRGLAHMLRKKDFSEQDGLLPTGFELMRGRARLFGIPGCEQCAGQKLLLYQTLGASNNTRAARKLKRHFASIYVDCGLASNAALCRGRKQLPQWRVLGHSKAASFQNETQLRAFVTEARSKSGAGRGVHGGAAVGGRISPANLRFREMAHPSYGSDACLARSNVSIRRTRRRARWAIKDALVHAHTAKGRHWSEFHELRVIVPAAAPAAAAAAVAAKTAKATTTTT